MDAQPQRPHRRRWIVWSAAALMAVAGLGLAGLAWTDHYLRTGLRDHAVAMLEQRLQSKVQLASLEVSLRPHITVRGSGLVMRHHGRSDVPPLVAVGAFEAQIPWSGYFEQPRRVSSVTIRGLRITMPPKDGGGLRGREGGGCQDRGAVEAVTTVKPEPSPFVIDRLTTSDATLTLLPSRPDKQPRVFEIGSVVVSRLALDRPAAFEATLTNPVPRGHVVTKGEFGPWNPGDPAATSLRGDYRFSDGNLASIKGIDGRLQSSGRFDGRLRQIIVHGQASVTDFGLTTSRNRLPLESTFETCIDGTDGDTYLDRVDARLASTPIAATGKVEGQVGREGRVIALDVKVAEGRIEDMLRLAVNDATPVMTGRLDTASSFELPPGPEAVIERLALKGRFSLQGVRFREGGVQSKINELSRRGRGDLEAGSASLARSSFGGTYVLDDSILRLPTFRFAVPGAVVELQGQYGLTSERIDFRGRLRTDARVSQMTTGVTSTVLRVIDPLFARDGAGAVFPITIGGTRQSPSFKVDVRKAVLGKD